MNINVIEDIRKSKRITVKELCDHAGIDRSTYYKLLKNPDMIRFSTWTKIADFLEMTKTERKESLM